LLLRNPPPSLLKTGLWLAFDCKTWSSAIFITL
jgi:hypothetical protein